MNVPRLTRVATWALIALAASSHVTMAVDQLNGGNTCGVALAVVQVPVTLVSNSRNVAGQLDLLYDATKLTPGTPTLGGAAAGGAVDSRVTSPGNLRILVYSNTNAELASGTLVTVPFTLASGATGPQLTLPIPINGQVSPPFSGPGVILANIGSEKSVPSPNPGSGTVDIVQVTSPSDRTACIGGSSSFTASATGSGPFTYQWKRNGQTIPGANAATYVEVVDPEDAGPYTCDMTNSCGAFQTTPALLNVLSFACSPALLQTYDPGTGALLSNAWTANPSPAVTNYRLYWSTNSGGPYTNFQDVGTGAAANIGNLTNGTRYFFRVSSWVATTEGPFGNEANAVPTGGAFNLPSAPDYGYQTSPSADIAHPDVTTYRFPGRSGDVTLYYDAYDVSSPGEVSVQLNGTQVGAPATTGVSSWSGSQTLLLPDTLVNNGTPNVLTFDDTFNPPGLSVWGVRNVSIKLPAAQVSPLARNQTVDLVIAQNPAEPSLASYYVFRSTSSGFFPSLANQIATGVPGGSYRDQSGLVNGTPYYYVVRGIDTIQNAGFDSSQMSATPTNAVVTPVFDLRVSKSGAADVRLDWSSVVTSNSVSAYRIYTGTSPSSLTLFQTTGPAAVFFVMSGHQSDSQKHYYSVKVVDGLGTESAE